ncbi:MFS transporter small subunit [Streptomyces sp. CA-288835]|uniref:MFS transporter small subunit n=1 Tax=Streptomyces sp. CA-288835 TaxID=3240069 RepID=UPI003D920A91
MSTSDSSPPSAPATTPPGRRGLIAFSWVWVGAPLAYGLYELVRKATQLFTG